MFSVLYLWAANDAVSIILPLGEAFVFSVSLQTFSQHFYRSLSPGYSAVSHGSWVLAAQSAAESGGSLWMGLWRKGFSLCTDPGKGGHKFVPLQNWMNCFTGSTLPLLFTAWCKLQKDWEFLVALSHSWSWKQHFHPGQGVLPSSSGVDHMVWYRVLLAQVQDSRLCLPLTFLFAHSSGLPSSESQPCLWARRLVSPIWCPGH